MKLIQTTRVVEVMDATAAVPSVPDSTKRTKTKATSSTKCRCKTKRCTDCQLCIKCQCHCNGPPQNSAQPVDGPTNGSPSNLSPKSSEADSESVHGRRRASRTNEPDVPKRLATKDDAAAATTPRPRTPSPKRPDNRKRVSEQDASKETKVWVKLTCRCKARRCAECTACTKCSCACNSYATSPSSASGKRKVTESPVKPPPSKKAKAAPPPKPTTPRRPTRHAPTPAVEIDTKELQADAVRRRRSPRGGNDALIKDEDDGVREQVAKAEPPVQDDEAAAAMKMDEETRKMDEELRAWMGKRSDEQEELTQLEKQIYELEGSYLRRSQHAGNIVKGYADANVFVAQMAKDDAQEDTPEVEAAVNDQRLFSHSSTTSPAEALKSAAEDAAAVAADIAEDVAQKPATEGSNASSRTTTHQD